MGRGRAHAGLAGPFGSIRAHVGYGTICAHTGLYGPLFALTRKKFFYADNISSYQLRLPEVTTRFTTDSLEEMHIHAHEVKSIGIYGDSPWTVLQFLCTCQLSDVSYEEYEAIPESDTFRTRIARKNAQFHLTCFSLISTI